MALPFPIASSQTDAKSPVDDQLMDAIRENLDHLDTATASGSGVFEWKINGSISRLRSSLPFRRIDGAFVSKGQTLSTHAVSLDLPGLSGTLEIDVRKYRSPDTPITAIEHIYSQSINSIARVGSSISTQSITKATPQVNTQSIAYWKAAINIESIIYLGRDLWRYNLSSALDDDWVAGTDYVLFDSCTDANNDGTFRIVRTNDDDLNNIIVYNPSGVAQSSAAGTVTLLAFAYNLTNPASSEFVAGEKARLASHTDANNDGDLEVYAVNSGGNNLIFKNQNGVEQGSAAGTIDSLRWTYTYSSAVPADYVAGETAYFAGHTDPNNDGNLPVTGTNAGGNNITVYNPNGALQGTAAGTADTNRWVYALPTDPSTAFSLGHKFVSNSTTSTANAGTFNVVEINRSATNNLVVHNESGVAQVSAAGTLTHTRRLIKFSSDQISTYSTASRVGISGTPDASYHDEFDVLEVNRGGGANYNIVIDKATGGAQASPAGLVEFESRSVFSTRPTITVHRKLRSVQNGVFDTTEKVIEAGRTLYLEILQIPTGSPENLTVHVA